MTPESLFAFCLEGDDVQVDAEGKWFALNRNLEWNFQTYKRCDGKIFIASHSSQFEQLCANLEETAKDGAQLPLIDNWVDRIEKAALAAGAVVAKVQGGGKRKRG